MYLVVGLGNPGAQYDGTRHNAGFYFLDYLAGRFDISFSESKWQAVIAKTSRWQKKFLLMKPETFMNRSGDAVAPLAHFFKIEKEKIIVIHDDIDVPFGRIKAVSGGGAGGHNGIRSIIEKLGTDAFSRIKIGVGRPVGPIPPDRFVLSRFSEDERVALDERMPDIEEGLRMFVREGIDSSMNVLNRKPVSQP